MELRLGEATAAQPPLCLVLVDASGDDDFLEVARAALHAAVAALCEAAPATLFGIIAFSDTVALLHDELLRALTRTRTLAPNP